MPKSQTTQIKSWFNSGLGAYLLALEQPIVDKSLSHCFGRFLLQVGPLCTIASPIKGIAEIVSLGGEGANADIICQEYAWPILTEGIECVLLQHALDFASSAHNVLREAARCVRPGGHLFIVGFNPYSPWGVYRRCSKNALSYSQSIAYGRLVDWLKLLGFSIEDYWTGGYGLPRLRFGMSKHEVIGQQRKWYGNGFYVINARKLMIKPSVLEKKRRTLLDGIAPIPVINRSDIKLNE